MSILNQIFKTIKETTGIDAGNIAGSAKKTAEFSLMSKKAKGLALLNWRWSDDAGMSDNRTGRPLRNWDRQVKLEKRVDDIFLNWEKQPEAIEEYLLFFGWQGWPYSIIERDDPEQYFLPEFVEALANDQFNSVKHLVIKASDVPLNCIKFPASESDNEFYYLKVVGKTSDEKYVDIKGCTLASLYQREKNKLGPVSGGEILQVKVPSGGRDRNELESQLIKKAKAQRS